MILSEMILIAIALILFVIMCILCDIYILLNKKETTYVKQTKVCTCTGAGMLSRTDMPGICVKCGGQDE